MPQRGKSQEISRERVISQTHQTPKGSQSISQTNRIIDARVPAAQASYSTISTDSINTVSTGTSPSPFLVVVGTVLIASTTSLPDVTLPKTQ